jgi:hypothetical protein
MRYWAAMVLALSCAVVWQECRLDRAKQDQSRLRKAEEKAAWFADYHAMMENWWKTERAEVLRLEALVKSMGKN